MKLNKNFVKHTMDGVCLVVPVEGANFNGIIQGNRSVEVILDCLENDVTQEEIVQHMLDTFDGDENKIRADVSDVISRLKEIGAIDD